MEKSASLPLFSLTCAQTHLTWQTFARKLWGWECQIVWSLPPRHQAVSAHLARSYSPSPSEEKRSIWHLLPGIIFHLWSFTLHVWKAIKFKHMAICAVLEWNRLSLFLILKLYYYYNRHSDTFIKHIPYVKCCSHTLLTLFCLNYDKGFLFLTSISPVRDKGSNIWMTCSSSWSWTVIGAICYSRTQQQCSFHYSILLWRLMGKAKWGERMPKGKEGDTNTPQSKGRAELWDRAAFQKPSVEFLDWDDWSSAWQFLKLHVTQRNV